MFTLHDLHKVLDPEHYRTIDQAVIRASSGLWALTRWVIYGPDGRIAYRSRP